MSKPIFNIITRTAGRPNYFKTCQDSINSQTYPAELIKKYIIFDDEMDFDGYINQRSTGMICVEMEREKRKNNNHFPYHLYLNETIQMHVIKTPGWVVIVDDDQFLADQKSLEILAKQIIDRNDDSDCVYIWKCRYMNHVVPSDLTFNKEIKSGDFQICCFAFHTNHANQIKFEPNVGAEVDVVRQLCKSLKCVWIDEILTCVPTSGHGTRQDTTTTETPKKKIILKSNISSKTPTTFQITRVEDVDQQPKPVTMDEIEEEEILGSDQKTKENDIEEDEEEEVIDEPDEDEDPPLTLTPTSSEPLATTLLMKPMVS